MKKILVLGAGMVAKPLVHYLLNQENFNVTVASRTVNKAQKIVNNHPKSDAVKLDVEDKAQVSQMIEKSDIVISLLPWTLHPTVAKLCLELGKNLVTTSYVKDEMASMDNEVKNKNLIFLNEIGVDPGLDHMAAMKVIDEVSQKGGKIKSFYSYCGGLPAMENNNNPLGYKFSWSPEGALLATKNDGIYLKEGNIIKVPQEKLFEHYWFLDVPGAGVFEAYVNRDALPYRDIYNIQSASSIYRGTLRNVGHCETWSFFKKIDLLNQIDKFDFDQDTPLDVMAKIINGNPKNIIEDFAKKFNIEPFSATLKKMKWLGLFNDKKLPIGKTTVFDMFAYLLKEKLVYDYNEIDLLLQHHEFVAEYPDNKKERITSTLIDKGIVNGDSSMSRTVGLPAAIATKLILNDKINIKGVVIPVLPQIYNLVLEELEKENIKFIEKREIL